MPGTPRGARASRDRRVRVTAVEPEPRGAQEQGIEAGTVKAYATEAGFRRVEILSIEHDLWRVYLLSD